MNDFELFKSNMCQHIKKINSKEFIAETLKQKVVEKHFDHGDYEKGLYLVALIDYLCRRDHLEYVKQYDKYRNYKFKKPIFPASVELISQLLKKDTFKKAALKNAIPEFLRFNIVEGEIENVY